MKDHPKKYLIVFLVMVFFIGLGVVLSQYVNPNWFGLSFVLTIPALFVLVFYFAIEKIIPCPLCKKEDQVILEDYLSETYGNEEKLNRFKKLPGVLFCKRCEYKFDYALPRKEIE